MDIRSNMDFEMIEYLDSKYKLLHGNSNVTIGSKSRLSALKIVLKN